MTLTLCQLVVLGTPAEEAGGGKIDLLRAGVFEGVDAAMMAHPNYVSASDVPSLAMTE